MNLYNEIDANAGQWMQNLMDAGEIPQGRIDARPIQQLTGADLAGVRQFHTFAGIGGWPLALRLAAWPEDREVWTGSCPCQPFSSAGKGKGTADERHLWPEFFRLIKERRPATIFGEQVGSKAGIGWLDGVQADLEGEDYACGAVIVGAHSVGAPHIRQRIYWGASRTERLQHAESYRWDERRAESGGRGLVSRRPVDGVGNPGSAGLQGVERGGTDPGEISGGEAGAHGPTPEPGDDPVRLADDERRQHKGRVRGPQPPPPPAKERASADIARCGSDGPWSDYRIIPCTDGKARRTGARVFPLAYAWPRDGREMGESGSRLRRMVRDASRARLGMLKGSGNAIVPELAAEFIRAFMEVSR